MEKLTKKQDKILEIIKKFVAKNGYSPTIRELCDICELRSPATMFVHVKKLEEKGYLKQTKKKFRTIELSVPNEYEDKKNETVSVPLLGKVAAGNPIEAIERPDDFFSLPKYLIPRNKEIFTLEVSGDSMIEAGIFNNDIVIVERKETANNGEIVVALDDNNSVTLKRFYKEKGYFRLQPENSTMEPIILSNVSILGKAIGLYRKM
ncbi:MAG: transcriptional repressor LexA [Bacilli bacterium]|nr:transcriptional repressor LexA [Bacilli bacterium]